VFRSRSSSQQTGSSSRRGSCLLLAVIRCSAVESGPRYRFSAPMDGRDEGLTFSRGQRHRRDFTNTRRDLLGAFVLAILEWIWTIWPIHFRHTVFALEEVRHRQAADIQELVQTSRARGLIWQISKAHGSRARSFRAPGSRVRISRARHLMGLKCRASRLRMRKSKERRSDVCLFGEAMYESRSQKERL